MKTKNNYRIDIFEEEKGSGVNEWNKFY
jgi:hypothetical protein